MHTYVHTYIHINIHLHTFIYIDIYIDIYIHLYTYKYLFTYLYIYAYMHAYIHIFKGLPSSYLQSRPKNADMAITSSLRQAEGDWDSFLKVPSHPTGTGRKCQATPQATLGCQEMDVGYMSETQISS